MHAYRPNHYEELGVLPGADAEEIRTAYRGLAKQLHPDVSDDDPSESKEAFLRLQEAYDVLRDPQRRADYDRELAGRAAREQAAREAARQPIRQRPMQPPPMQPRPTQPRPAEARPGQSGTAARRPLSRRIAGLRGYLAALGLVVIVTAGIAAWQLLFPTEPPPTTIVAVDPDSRGRAAGGAGSGAPPRPHDPGILTKDVDRSLQAQIDRVEAARKRRDAQLSELEAHRVPPSGGRAPGAPPAMLVPRVECTGRGTSIVLVRDKDIVTVSFDNGPPVQPRISDLGTGIVLVSRIEPTNKFAVAFTKGDGNGTLLLLFGQSGSMQQAINIKCNVATF